MLSNRKSMSYRKVILWESDLWGSVVTVLLRVEDQENSPVLLKGVFGEMSYDILGHLLSNSDI